jgi:cytochrome c-type biogenesis protein
VSTISNIGLVTAFSAGLISFLSPCVLPLVPGYVSYISGSTLDRRNHAGASHLTTLLLSTCFVLGFSTVFVALGATATAFSRLLLSYRYEATLVGGAIVIVFGVFMTGLIRLPWLERDVRFHGSIRGGRPFGAFLLGLAFGFGWTPCIGPVLGAILTVGALSSTASTGIVLLTV